VTHAELVTVAAKWLRKTRGCGVVLTEHGGGHELPDAIGWKGGFSVLVEVKVSRGDFFADRRKPSRASAATRPASVCFYLTPPGLLKPTEIPEGWGLLEFDGRIVRVLSKHEPGWDDRDRDTLRAEVYRLYCEVRRYQIHGMKYPPLDVRRERRRLATMDKQPSLDARLTQPEGSQATGSATPSSSSAIPCPVPSETR
jgi:hypothetical protein